MPDLTKEFVVWSDARNDGIGVAYSKNMMELSLLQKELLYCGKRMFGDCVPISRFLQYLYCRKFTLETDHEALAYLAHASHVCAHLMWWLLYLQEYQMVIKYISGSKNVIADYMSWSEVKHTDWVSYDLVIHDLEAVL